MNTALLFNKHIAPATIPVTELFTIGYEGRSIDDYCTALQLFRVEIVVDVRRNPISRKKGFSKSALSAALASHDIGYIHLPGLGIDSSYRQDLSDAASYQRLFDFYERELLPKATDSIDKLSRIIRSHKSVALTCYEADPSFCHRHCVAEKCVELGMISTQVVNL